VRLSTDPGRFILVKKLLFGLVSFIVIFGGFWLNRSGVNATGLPPVENGISKAAGFQKDRPLDLPVSPNSADLADPNSVVPGLAILFDHSASSAGASLTPEYQGTHTSPGELPSFDIQIYNAGNLGTDTYNLEAASVWPVTFFAADGITPITDTGPVDQGGNVAIVAKVQTPGNASLGNYNAAVVTATSSLDPLQSGTATLQTAVPAPFAQTYIDWDDPTMMTYLAHPYSQTVKTVAPADSEYEDMAIAETPGFVQVWSWDGFNYNNLEYALLDDSGEVTRPVTSLTDHASAELETADLDPAVAVAPDGNIGIIWFRELYLSGEYNDNIWFAILNPAGDVIFGPQNITNNEKWGYSDDPGVPRYHQPVITATGDNRFILSWSSRIDYIDGCSDDCKIYNVYYKVHDSTGGEVKAITQLTDDVLDANKRHDDSNLTPLSGNRALLVWECDDDITVIDDICYVVVDSGGTIIQTLTNISSYLDYSFDPDAVQLSSGNILVTWNSRVNDLFQIFYAVLDGTYALAAGPTNLDKPSAPSGNRYPSIAAAGNKAVITWEEEDLDLNLFYALVDGSGTVLTPPMIFLTAENPYYPYLGTNYRGYGNTSYTQDTPDTPDTLLFLPLLLR